MIVIGDSQSMVLGFGQPGLLGDLEWLIFLPWTISPKFSQSTIKRVSVDKMVEGNLEQVWQTEPPSIPTHLLVSFRIFKHCILMS